MGIILVCGCKRRPAGEVLGPGQGVCVGWPPFPVGSDGAVLHTVCYSLSCRCPHTFLCITLLSSRLMQ